MRSNDTLVDTPFQLISGFFHVNQGILCSEHAEQASSRGVLEGGGGAGEQQASCLVAKHVEFHISVCVFQGLCTSRMHAWALIINFMNFNFMNG